MDTIRGRLLRSLVIAVTAVGLSAAAHGAAGDAVPPVERLLVVTMIAAGAAFPLYRRRPPRAALVPLLGAAQLVLHPAFVWAADTAPGGHTAHAGGSGWLMAAAHLTAGLLAAALVVFTDRLIAAALRPRWIRLLSRLVFPRPADVTVVPVRPVRVVGGRAAEFVVRAPRRGPPARAC